MRKGFKNGLICVSLLCCLTACNNKTTTVMPADTVDKDSVDHTISGVDNLQKSEGQSNIYDETTEMNVEASVEDITDDYKGIFLYTFLISDTEADTWKVNFDRNTIVATINGVKYDPVPMTAEQRKHNWELLNDHLINPVDVTTPEIAYTSSQVAKNQSKKDKNGIINNKEIEYIFYDMMDYPSIAMEGKWVEEVFDKVLDYDTCCQKLESYGLPTDKLTKDCSYVVVLLEGNGYVKYLELLDMVETSDGVTLVISFEDADIDIADTYHQLLFIPTSMPVGTKVDMIIE